MNIKGVNSNCKFCILLSIIAFIITIILIITGAYMNGNYDIKVGAVSPKKFIASDTVKNEVATNRLIEAAVAEVSPLYTHDKSVQDKVISELNTFFIQTTKFINDLKNKKNNSEQIQIPEEYMFQTLSPATMGSEDKNTLSSKVYLSQPQLELLLNLSAEEFNKFKDDIFKIINNVLEQGYREDSETKNLIFIKDEFTNLDLSDELSDVGYNIVASLIEPNLIVDTEATEKAKKEAAEEIEPVMILKNQKIVDEGEIITEEIYSILDSLGYIHKSNIMNNIIPIAGTCIFILILFLSVLFYIYNFYNDLCSNRKEAFLLFTLYIILIVSTRMITGLPYFFVPILTFSMLLSMLIDSRLASFINLSATVICGLIYKGDFAFLLYFSLTGMLSSLTTRYTTERNRIVFVGILNSFLNSFVIIGITLFIDKEYELHLVSNITYAFASSLLTLIMSIGSLPLWENIFGIATSVKLLDLTNPDKELLRRLMIEAPGTYHHSLIVANLAESAAYDVGANPVLARVGAYYHDIGKLKYPQYFSENIVGENLHDYMDPYSSARVIVSHVSSGVELAEKYKLPQSVKDIIAQHHGNTMVKFFYHKATKMYTEDVVHEKDFRYNFDIPQSKEAAVVMLADTAEAAVRSILSSGKTMNEIELFVKDLIRDKLNDNQLTESNLSIKDLNTIANSFMGIFKGMYHERISYPVIKNKSENKLNGETE